MPDTAPNTERSRGLCECATLRHQLRLADELARASANVLASAVHEIDGDDFVLKGDELRDLKHVLHRYSVARRLVESGRSAEAGI